MRGWAIAVGILGIVFSCMGFFSSVQLVKTPSSLKFIQTTIDTLSPQASDQFKRQVEASIGTPAPWYGRTCWALGIIGFIINALYFYFSIELIRFTPQALKIFSRVLWSSVGWGIARSLANIFGMSGSGLKSILAGSIGIALDLILFAFIALGKESENSKSPQSQFHG